MVFFGTEFLRFRAEEGYEAMLAFSLDVVRCATRKTSMVNINHSRISMCITCVSVDEAAHMLRIWGLVVWQRFLKLRERGLPVGYRMTQRGRKRIKAGS